MRESAETSQVPSAVSSEMMEERGYVGPFEGSKPRQLLITREKWQELQMAKGASPAEPDKPADRYGSINDVFESHDALE